MVFKILRKIKNLIETSPWLSRFFDRVAFSWFYRKMIERKIKSYTKNIKESKKYNIIIETTNVCNAGCIMCPHSIMNRGKGVMEDDVFQLIHQRLQEEKINPTAFILNGFGDPLTDTKIFDRADKIKKYFPNSIVKFYTNLGLANPKIIDRMLDSSLDEVNVSFNGSSEENYEKTMKISWKKTLENLNQFVNRRKAINSKMKIRLSMALVESNEGDEKKILETWSDKVDSISINKVHSYGGSLEDVSGKNKINRDKLTYPCKYIWNTIVFGVKGDIFLCCLDYEGQYNYGNIKDQKILDVFYSDRFEKMRQMHLDNNIKKIKICDNCYTPYKNGVEWLVEDLY